VAAATDFGKLKDGSFFLVLEYIEGKSLRDVINLGRVEPRRAMHILKQVAAALSRAHALGIVHRDLKPENVLIDRNERWRLTDFGIAHGPGITERHRGTGTPEFAAPEQIMGEPQGPSVDLFAMGAIIAYTVTGRFPFGTGDARRIVARQLNAQVDLDGAPAPLIPFLTRALAAQPEKRFADAAEMRTAWHGALDELQDEAERGQWWWRWLGKS
jgi:serine/threonine-protein kinase